MFEAIPQYRTLSVMPTYKCTAACKHCGTYSNPRNEQSLDINLILSAIDQASQNGYKVAVFTGGEPTLSRDGLLRGIERAASAGLVTRVVTNAWWATNEEAGSRWAASLARAGLNEINFSTGDQHTKFVPLENIIRACRAVLEAGLRTICIMVEIVKERTITAGSITRHPAYRELSERFPAARIPILESPWMPMSPSATAAYPDGMTANRSNLGRLRGCQSCLNTTTIQADGRIAACCGLGMRSIPELQLGHIGKTTLKEADRLAADDFLKRWIRVEGPVRILAWAATHNENIKWEDMYAHICQACLRLYKDPEVRAVVREHHQEKLADVLMAEWLLYHYNLPESHTEGVQTGEGWRSPENIG